jgi:hypothetical protein
MHTLHVHEPNLKGEFNPLIVYSGKSIPTKGRAIELDAYKLEKLQLRTRNDTDSKFKTILWEVSLPT